MKESVVERGKKERSGTIDQRIGGGLGSTRRHERENLYATSTRSFVACGRADWTIRLLADTLQQHGRLRSAREARCGDGERDERLAKLKGFQDENAALKAETAGLNARIAELEALLAGKGVGERVRLARHEVGNNVFFPAGKARPSENGSLFTRSELN